MTETHHGCPVVHTDYRGDRPIFEHYALLDAEREQAPVLWNDSTKHPFWMVTRYDHVTEALRMTDVFSNEVINALQPWMAVKFLPQNLDGPEHLNLRRVPHPPVASAPARESEPVVLEAAPRLRQQ